METPEHTKRAARELTMAMDRAEIDDREALAKLEASFAKLEAQP